MRGALWCLSLFVVLHYTNCASGVIPIFVESLVGSTTLHQKQNWKFDPNEAKRLNPDFEAQHGHKSVILIERLGLGIDGNQQERKLQQHLRDQIPIENFIPKEYIN